MRNIFFVLALIFTTLSAPAAFGRWRFHHSRWIRCTATAYSVSGETKDGDVTKYRQTIAADPAVIPLGSRVRIKGAGRYSGIYTVTDTGRKIQGNCVDIYIPSTAAAKEFGKKDVRVRILKIGHEKPAQKEAAAPRSITPEARLQPGSAARP